MPATFAFWICGCAYLNCAGWMLSALHQLNLVGYVVALLPGVVTTAVWLKKTARPFPWRKFPRRFRRPLPGIFLFLTAAIFLGGSLYAPTNYDALTYRLPRMLNWLMDGAWHWIPTINGRMNCANTGWEWVAMPLMVFTHSDRGFFLINALGFCLLPGLLFGIFRQLGVGRRVAWTWMWLLPLAYGYALQAGSIGNDLTGTVFGLLAVFFGLRARRSRQVADVWFTLLAVALMTGVKISSAPLALPALVAAWPALAQLRKHRLVTLVVLLVAGLVSAVPTMALNQFYTGSWTGDPNNQSQMQVKNPVTALLGNSLLVADQALMPPVLPDARPINAWLNRHLPDAWQARLKQNFPRFYLTTLNELPAEEAAGLGLGCTGLLLLGAILTLWQWRRWREQNKGFPRLSAVVLAAWIAGGCYMLKIGSEAAPRLMLPYYPLLLVPWLLLPGQSELLRRRAGRILVLLAALSILPALILSAARPLWPGQTVCEKLLAQHPGYPFLQRMATVYSAYAHRNDILALVRDRLPADVREIGFVAGSNDSDYSLWRPFGQRKVVYLRYNIRQFLDHPGDPEWVVVKQNAWTKICATPLETWAAAHQAEIVARVPIVELVSWGSENWYLLHFKKPAGPGAGQF